MAESTKNEVEERELYSDGQVKLTDRRISCNYITIPIGDIECVGTGLRIGLFNISIGSFIISLVPFFLYAQFPQFKVLLLLGAVMMIASLIFILKMYRTYVNLYVTAGHHKILLLSAPMNKRDYVYNISEKLAEIVIEEKHLESKKREIEADLPSYIDPSMTMLLRMAANQEKSGTGKDSESAPESNPETNDKQDPEKK